MALAKKLFLIPVMAWVILFFLTHPLCAREKIALLFLTYKTPLKEDLWIELLDANHDKFSIYIHPKKRKKVKGFFKDYIIRKKVRNSWLNHVYCWQELIREAVQDKDNQKFVFLSESCVPLHPLSKIYDLLLQDTNSYVKYGHRWWKESDAREVIELPKEHRWGSHEWVILNRKHAEMFANDKTVISLVAKHPHDAESYVPSMLSYYGVLKEPDVINKITTYVNWSLDHELHPFNPYSFERANDFNKEILRQAKQEGCLFARKVLDTFSTFALLEIIEE